MIVVQVQKPPLGIKPRLFVLESRLKEIDDAIIRYVDALMLIPDEWVQERNEIIQIIQRIREDG